MKYIKNYFLLFSILLFFPSIVLTQNNTNNRKLRVGVSIMEPFVFQKQKKYVGLSIDLWKRISDSLGYTSTFMVFSENEMLEALAENELDICISPLAVTPSRIEKFDFSQPYYITNLAFAVKSDKEHAFIDFIEAMFSIDFFKSLAPLAFIVIVFGTLIWMIERRKNPSQFRTNHKGLMDGVWWSATTMTTVGYGDKAPVTNSGRILGMIWMFTAVITISGLTASIASSLTLNKLTDDISTFDDLRKIKVGSVKGSGTADLLSKYNVDFRSYSSVDQGLKDVEDGEIKAFVYDETMLTFKINDLKISDKLKVVPSSYFKEYFSFAATDNELIRAIDVELIDVIDSQDWQDDLKKYGLVSQK
jgi:polar amino acid transport system substrate-binding protein